MSIGEVLAEARCQAGLTVAQVSQRTRIRQTIIRGIEGDDYSVCGGDFYARGHIRSVAKVVGTDPEPLVREYDAVYRPPGAISAVSLDELLTSAETVERRRHWPVVLVLGLLLMVALGAAAYQFFPGPRRAAGAAPATRSHSVTHHHRRGRANPVPEARYARTVVIHLTAIRGCWVVFTTSGGRPLSRLFAAPGTSHSWTFRRPVDMRLSEPRAIKLTVDGKNPLQREPGNRPLTLSLGLGRLATVGPSPHITIPPRMLTPVSAAAFGRQGAGQGDNAQLAPLAIDGNPATAWRTDWYTTARFGNLYQGTGMLLDMGRPVTITAARITLGAPGARFELRVGARPALAGLTPVAHAANAGGVVRLRLPAPAHGRYVLVWFTRLPADPAGTFQASVYEINLAGRP